MSVLGKDVTAILIKIRNGDEESKNVLFEKTYNHLKIIAYRYVCNKNDVEDVVMETYLKIFRYVYSFKPWADGYNWICKILQNIAYDFNKANQNEIPAETLDNGIFERDIEEVIAANDEMRRWLAPYPLREQKMLYLRFWEGRSIEEIARILGMGKSNAHKQIKKVVAEIEKKGRGKWKNKP